MNGDVPSQVGGEQKQKADPRSGSQARVLAKLPQWRAPGTTAGRRAAKNGGRRPAGRRKAIAPIRFSVPNDKDTTPRKLPDATERTKRPL